MGKAWDKFLEFPLYCDFAYADSRFAMMKDAEECALEVLYEIVDGGKDYLTDQKEVKKLTASHGKRHW